MKKGLKVFFKYLFLFLIGGAIYVIIELVCRGRSHWTMAVVGGICFVLCGLLNEIFTWKSTIWFQMLICSLIITAGLNGIREDVYQLILRAEHMYNESGAGKQKFDWVIQQARGLLPKWLQMLVPESALKNLVQKWFDGVKDLLDDGKVNNSQK